MCNRISEKNRIMISTMNFQRAVCKCEMCYGLPKKALKTTIISGQATQPK